MYSTPISGQQNVGQTERLISMIAGGTLALMVLKRAPLTLLLAALGGYLAYRGATGNCPIYKALDLNTVTNTSPDFLNPHPAEQRMDEALEDSFPASDPPSWSPSAA